MKLISITLLMHVTPALTLLTDLFYTEMYELSLDARTIIRVLNELSTEA